MLRLAVILVLGVLTQQILADEPEAIVGGSPASPGEFPHQGSLQYHGQHICGCSIIDSTHILTAAHCVQGLNAQYFTVVTGTIYHRRGHTHPVAKIIIHPYYGGDASNSWVNDIAVIKLSTPIQLDRFQTPIPLATSPPQPGAQCTLSGWGMTSANGQIPQNLLKMDTFLIDLYTCQNRFGPNQPLTSSHLCAFYTRGVGACQGDSGGPLICNGQQYGITSFVLPCAVGAPDVYTSVYHHRDFIRQCIAGY